MTNPSLQIRLPPQWLDQQDTLFFKLHPERRAHIRKALGAESEAEFRTLGDHERNRRRILLWRVPETNPYFEQLKQTQGGVPILKIPMLLFSDETVEDEDAVLLPMIHEIMKDAAQ
jgi:hypothetical protein